MAFSWSYLPLLAQYFNNRHVIMVTTFPGCTIIIPSHSCTTRICCYLVNIYLARCSKTHSVYSSSLNLSPVRDNLLPLGITHPSNQRGKGEEWTQFDLNHVDSIPANKCFQLTLVMPCYLNNENMIQFTSNILQETRAIFLVINQPLLRDTWHEFLSVSPCFSLGISELCWTEML